MRHDGQSQAEEVSIYAFDANAFVKDWEQILDFNSAKAHVSILRSFSQGNHKQILQQGLYTFSNVYDQRSHIEQLEAQVAAQTGNEQHYLWELDISVTEMPKVMRELRLMAINPMTLFPGVEGVCRNLKDMFFAPTKVGQTPAQRMQEILSTLPADEPSKSAADTTS